MPKTNPWAFPRPTRKHETRTLKSPRNQAEYTFTLRRLDPVDATLASEAADELIERHVTGGPDREPDLFPAPDGQPLKLSPRLVGNLVNIEAMQCGPEPDRYSFTELVGLMVVEPEVYGELFVWAQELNGGEDAAGNAAGAVPES